MEKTKGNELGITQRLSALEKLLEQPEYRAAALLLSQIFSVDFSKINQDPPFQIAKGDKELFVLIMYILYKKGMFVTRETGDDEEHKAKNFKAVMQWLGVPFGEKFENPFALLQEAFEREDALNYFYELLNMASKRINDSREDREAKNRSRSKR